MADKKVSQETDLGVGGIDGTVQYRVIKGGGTFRQSYAALFQYIGQNVAPFIQKTETEAKALCSGGGVISGALYQITLDGTSQGNNTDLIFCTGIASTDFGQSMDYFHQSAGRVLHIQGTFTASGFTLLRADEAATFLKTVDSSLSTSVDFSEIRMFGCIDITDVAVSPMPIDNFSGIVNGDTLTLKCTDASVIIDVFNTAIHYNNGFVGNLTFTQDDSITFQRRNGGYHILYATGSYTGGPRRYVALLNQSGTSAPVATILENTLGGVPVWSYVDVGSYLATLTGVFTADKTVHQYRTLDTDASALYNMYVTNPDTCGLYSFLWDTFDAATPPSLSNGLLINHPITIEVYP